MADPDLRRRDSYVSAVEGKISGAGKLLARLGEVQNVVFIALNEEIEAGAMAIHSDAVKSVQEHQSDGRVYKRGGVEHTASEPGFAPNTDRGQLAQSIKFEIDRENLTAIVGTNLKYGAYLEMGTTNIKARPWLFPAFEKNRDAIRKAVSSVISAAIRGAGK